MPPPQGDSSSNFSLHVVDVPGVNAIYLGAGMYAQTSGAYNFGHRPYGVKLPNNYDPNTAYAVTFGGGGCGGSASGFASNPGGALQIAPNGTTIQIGLSYINGCFADGGPSIGNRNDTPELPYFRTVLAEIEAKLCVDRAKVFVSGYSSGAWEAFTLGCAAADVIRGISSDEGGMRAVRPPCTGPVAAFMVAGTADTENPIGPLAPTDGAYMRLGSPGSGPGRDDILMRNGCVGTATTQWDAAYPVCVKYTGCPAAYPVVWCALPGVGHNSSTYNNVNYSTSNGGAMWKFMSALP
jgi:polyhydroxybutyrate depolymerase